MKSQSRSLGNHLSLSSLMGLLHTCNAMLHMDICCKEDPVIHPFAIFPSTFLHPHVHGLPSGEVPSQGYAITHFTSSWLMGVQTLSTQMRVLTCAGECLHIELLVKALFAEVSRSPTCFLQLEGGGHFILFTRNSRRSQMSPPL